MTFDTATIAFVSICIDLVLVLILLHTWRTRTTYPGFVTWIAATACWSAGSLLSLLCPDLHPRFIPKIIGNGLVMLHPLLLYRGIQRFHGLRRRWWGTPLNCLLVAAALLVLCHFLYRSESLSIRSVAITLVLAILFGRTCLEPLFAPSSRRYSMQWLLSACLAPLVTLLLVRVWMQCATVPPANFAAMMSYDSLLRALLFYGIIVELLIAYSYLSLTSDRVEAELRRSEESYRELSSTLRGRVEEAAKYRVSQERLLANQSRMAAMGEMIGAIAHQWRQPLSILGMIVQNAHAVGSMDGLSQQQLDDFKDKSMRQVRHMSDTIEGFRNFYNLEKRKEPFCPYACIADAVGLFYPQSEGSGIAVEVLCPKGSARMVDGLANEFKQVVLNLLGNARDAILTRQGREAQAEAGRIEVAITVAGGGRMIIEVGDNGCGIPAEVAPRIFDPYFTTKEDSGGTGIGLYMSRLIVEESLGGRLSLVPGGTGAVFRMELPLLAGGGAEPDGAASRT